MSYRKHPVCFLRALTTHLAWHRRVLRCFSCLLARCWCGGFLPWENVPKKSLKALNCNIIQLQIPPGIHQERRAPTQLQTL
ncbi:hypothetical protein AV530_017831 [Patagioenas fasciata monilis]|uniref:Uncharacterized protein n=1 Tax=Patagioenas fasciata monilis TaxID=372326 RepID=A0A1V4J7Q0_PATFA|nr:hypothetical protein AV530_017831 [Patagioenas fasciata monilis]